MEISSNLGWRLFPLTVVILFMCHSHYCRVLLAGLFRSLLRAPPTHCRGRSDFLKYQVQCRFLPWWLSSVSYCAVVTLAFCQFLECLKLFSLQSIHTSCVLCLECSLVLCLSTFHFILPSQRVLPDPSNPSYVSSGHAVLFLPCIYNNLYL